MNRTSMDRTSMDRRLFRNLSGLQTQPPEERMMGACRSKAAPKKRGLDARPFWR